MPTQTIGEWGRDRFAAKVGDDIASLPETPEPEHTAPEPVDEPTILMERSTGGWRTELRLCADGRVAILVRQGEGNPRGCFVPPENALDAFNHPYVYLPA
jgi:hypothetical protein